MQVFRTTATRMLVRWTVDDLPGGRYDEARYFLEVAPSWGGPWHTVREVTGLYWYEHEPAAQPVEEASTPAPGDPAPTGFYEFEDPIYTWTHDEADGPPPGETTEPALELDAYEVRPFSPRTGIAWHYRLVDEEGATAAGPIPVTGDPDRYQARIFDLLKRHLRRDVGQPSLLLSRLVTGQHCPECYDTVLQRPERTDCSTCGGTGYLDSFSTPVRTYFSYNPVQAQFGGAGPAKQKQAQVPAFGAAIPLVQQEDIVVRLSDLAVFKVMAVRSTGKRGHMIRLNMHLQQLQSGSTMYKLARAYGETYLQLAYDGAPAERVAQYMDRAKGEQVYPPTKTIALTPLMTQVLQTQTLEGRDLENAVLVTERS